MQKDENHDAGASGLPTSPLDHDASSDGFQPSTKLRDMLEKLAKWRIARSLVEFPKDAPEFRGGNATVVRGFLASPSGGEDQEDHSDVTKGKSLDPDGPEGETSRPPKPVAVKKMNISDDRAKVLGLTLREAGLLVALSHKNVIKLKGFVEDLSKDIIWLVFPWEDNGTLRDFIASADWEIPERISLIYDVARGVQYLHSRTPPIRHGDLKSINVLVNSKYRAVITDFGSARRLVAKETDNETNQTENKPQAAPSLEATFCSATNTVGITLTGDQYTLRWAAPEVLREEEPCLGSDIWALGWVAYEPMIIPNPMRTTESAALRARSPALLVKLGTMHKQQGDYASALDFYTDALGSYRDIGDKGGESLALFGLAEVHRFLAESSEAIRFYSEALQICTDIGDKKVRASALFGLAAVHRQRNEYSQAVTFYSEALQIRTDIGDRQGRASALLGLAGVHMDRKEYNQAITFYSDALQIHTDFGNRRGRAETLLCLAEIHRLQTQYSQAITLNSEALNIATDLGDRYGRAYALMNLADVHREQGNYSDAIGPYTQAAEIFQQIGSTQNAGYASLQAVKVRGLSKLKEAARWVLETFVRRSDPK